MHEFPAGAPLVCLHEHADGWVRLDTFLELASGGTQEARNARRTMTRGQAAAMFRDAAWSKDLARCLAAFSLTSGVMQTPEAIQRVFREQVEDAAASGVVYLESRFAPSIHGRLGMAPDAIVEAALEGLRQGEALTGTRTGLIVCALRGMDDSESVARLGARHAGRGVVGFDVAGGPEIGHRVSEYAKALRLADSAGLGVCPHVGEADGPDAVADALETTFGMSKVRFGHALNATDRQVEEMARRGVVIEANASSNHATGQIESFSDHPVGRWVAMGAPVVLNTDDGGETIFGVSHRQEYEKVGQAFGFGRNEYAHILESGLGGAFSEPSVIEAVRRLAAERLAASFGQAPDAPSASAQRKLRP